MRGGGLRPTFGCAAIAFLAFCVAPATAQEMPSQKPVTLIVPFAAGGSTDVIARVIAEAMRASLGNPFIVDNRGGAGGSIGTTAIARLCPTARPSAWARPRRWRSIRPPTRTCPTISGAI
jgi:tripartite-type tricarboxylate transporter receptor subunit TctC